VPRKQRHTARRVWRRLVAEHDAALSEVTVSRYVARRRAELGLDRAEVSVPQLHLPGAAARGRFRRVRRLRHRVEGEICEDTRIPGKTSLGRGMR
jgi:hypothetical protein